MVNGLIRAFAGCKFLTGLSGKKRLEKHASLRDEVRCKEFKERDCCLNCLYFYKCEMRIKLKRTGKIFVRTGNITLKGSLVS